MAVGIASFEENTGEPTHPLKAKAPRIRPTRAFVRNLFTLIIALSCLTRDNPIQILPKRRDPSGTADAASEGKWGKIEPSELALGPTVEAKPITGVDCALGNVYAIGSVIRIPTSSISRHICPPPSSADIRESNHLYAVACVITIFGPAYITVPCLVL